MWAVQGFEPWTSPTQTENHTTRPNGQLTFSLECSRHQLTFLLLAQNTTPVGLEPTIFGSEDQRLIHWATGPAWAESEWLRSFLAQPVFSDQKVDLSGFEPEAFCMQSRRDTTTPQALRGF